MKVGNPKLDAIVKRPVKQLAEYSRLYPRLWREHDCLREETGKAASWPKWCYAPHSIMASCQTVKVTAARLYPTSDPESVSDFVSNLATLAAWRVTKGIYLFDETIFGELWKTPIEGDLPIELLMRLPEWCVYIPLLTPYTVPEPQTAVSKHMTLTVYGCFAQLDLRSDGPFLNLIMDMNSSEVAKLTDAVPMALGIVRLRLQGNLSKSLEAERDRVRASLKRQYSSDPNLALHQAGMLAWMEAQQNEFLHPVISLLLWLCSAKPEINGLDPLRGLRTKRTKKGLRNFGPDEPRVYEVAYRIGAVLRLNREAVARGVPGDGTHASPRPHIRRAHWHAFWTGARASISKEQPVDRKLQLRWLAPIAVCVGPDDAVIPTIHPVVLAEGRHDERFRIDHS